MKHIMLLFASLLAVTAQVEALEKLKSYNIDQKAITVSGISSGAFMATQLSTAYSETFSGAGSIAGGIYLCAEGSTAKAQQECMKQPSSLKTEDYIAQTMKLAESGEIDPVKNMAKQKLYIYASAKDRVLNPVASDKLYDFAKNFIAEDQIKYHKATDAGHGFPTLDYGAICGFGYLPWMLKCNFDAAGEILKTMYSDLKERGTMTASNLISFDQTEFGAEEASLFKNAWVYAPTACQNGEKCKLHVALHGCQMTPDYIQDQFVKFAGYNEWAETNNIIVLYPQAAKKGMDNPNACWDWYGYTGANYAVKSGPQMKSIKSMIDRLTK